MTTDPRIAALAEALHTRCEGKARLKCPCWMMGAREEAEVRRVRPAVREIVEYIRAIGDGDPAISLTEIAERVHRVFGERP